MGASCTVAVVKISQLPRLLRTLRYVPPGQIAARLAYRARTFLYRSPLYSFLLTEDVGSFDWVLVPPCLTPGDAARGKAAALREFRFAGHTLTLATASAAAWLPAKASALWVFNLHYHEWLADMRAGGLRDEARALVGEWLEHFDHWHTVAWHPYPLSLRVVAWLQHGPWLLDGADDDFRTVFCGSLQRQVAHLARNLELDLGGNHLVKNLKALVLTGLVVPGQEQLLVTHLASLLRQLAVQVHPDGGHYEATPSYHQQVLTDLMELVAVLRKKGGVAPQMTDVLARMGAALAFYRLGDGGLGLFNDGETGSPAQLDSLLKKLGIEAEDVPQILPDTGYARLQRGAMVALFDAGKVGPDENPGHAHADTLSFELSVGAERLVVNGGTYAYQHKLRNVFRGSASHSQPGVVGVDSAEVWAGFRVGRRPTDTHIERMGQPGAEAIAQGHHNGYRHVGVPVVARKLVMAADGSRLRGEDVWDARAAARGKRVFSAFGLHPAVGVRLVSDSEAQLKLPSGLVFQLKINTPGWRLDVKDFNYAPHFGVLETSKQVVALGRLAGAAGSVAGGARLDWTLVRLSPAA